MDSVRAEQATVEADLQSNIPEKDEGSNVAGGTGEEGQPSQYDNSVG